MTVPLENISESQGMRRQDYGVGWICAVQTVYVAACELLDKEHPLLPTDSPHDDNAYTLAQL